MLVLQARTGDTKKFLENVGSCKEENIIIAY